MSMLIDVPLGLGHSFLALLVVSKYCLGCAMTMKWQTSLPLNQEQLLRKELEEVEQQLRFGIAGQKL